MKNTHLFFYGKDFTLLKDSGTGKNLFELCYNGKKPKWYDEDDKQFAILKSFLEYSQENINNLIVDKSISKNNLKLYDYINQRIAFSGLVGVVSCSDFIFEEKKYDITLQISTRLDTYENDEDSNKKLIPYFLMTLLIPNYTTTKKSKIMVDEKEMTDLFLIYLFQEKYKNAFVKGYFRTYHRFEKNDDNVRGTINVSKHIKNNMGLVNGKLSYSYKEKSENNYLNQLIISAYESLKKNHLKEVQSTFDGCLELKNSLEVLKQKINYSKTLEHVLISKNITPLSSPYYTEYEELRKICLMILRNEKVSLFSRDGQNKIDGVLVYAPTLWEKFISQHFLDLNYNPQDRIYIYDVNGDKNYKQLTIPDFVIKNDEDNAYMIIDAKFKPGWLAVAKTGEIEDLLPDYDKCIRDMVSINANNCGVMFPTNEDIKINNDSFEINNEKFLFKHNISVYNSTSFFYTFPIHVPKINDKKNFIEWKEQFEANTKESFLIYSKLIKDLS